MAKAIKLKAWEEATEKMAIYRAARCALDKKRAFLEDALRKVQESYQIDIDALEGQVSEVAGELKAFVELRKKEFVAKEDGGTGRTQVRHGVEIGFRWGKPYLHIPKKFLDEAIAGLEEISPDTYVKRDPKLMKEVLKADLEKAAAAGDEGRPFIAKMNALHIVLDQDEEFVLEVVNVE